MASELHFDPGPAFTGLTLYAQLRNLTGQIWNTALATFQTPSAGTVTDYDIALTEQAGGWGYYVGTMPGVAEGFYYLTVKQQAGGAPAVADVRVGGGLVCWDGAAVVQLSNLPAHWGASVVGNGRTRDYFLQGGFNKTVRTSGAVTVYAADAAAVLVTSAAAGDNTLTPLSSVEPT